MREEDGGNPSPPKQVVGEMIPEAKIFAPEKVVRMVMGRKEKTF